MTVKQTQYCSGTLYSCTLKALQHTVLGAVHKYGQSKMGESSQCQHFLNPPSPFAKGFGHQCQDLPTRPFCKNIRYRTFPS